MFNCVAITRDGRGDLWGFPDFRSADLHPLVQYGDPILCGPHDIVKKVPVARLPKLLTRCGDQDMGAKIRLCLMAVSGMPHREVLARVGDYAHQMWHVIANRAEEPPSDPAQIVTLIVRDRKLSIEESRQMTEENLNPAAPAMPEGKKPKAPKAPKEPKEPKEPKAPKASKYPENAVIRLLNDKEGKKYGADNNPKRPGSASHERFSKYVDGMTVKEAHDAGVKTEDFAWDADKGFIEIVAA